MTVSADDVDQKDATVPELDSSGIVKLFESLNTLHRSMLLVCATVLLILGMQKPPAYLYSNSFNAIDRTYWSFRAIGDFAGSFAEPCYRKALIAALRSAAPPELLPKLIARIEAASIHPTALVLTGEKTAGRRSPPPEPVLLRSSILRTRYLAELANLQPDNHGINIERSVGFGRTFQHWTDRYTRAHVERVRISHRLETGQALVSLLISRPIKPGQREDLYLGRTAGFADQCGLSSDIEDQGVPGDLTATVTFPCVKDEKVIPFKGNSWLSFFGQSGGNRLIFPKGFGDGLYAAERGAWSSAVDKLMRDDPAKSKLLGLSMSQGVALFIGPIAAEVLLLMMLAATWEATREIRRVGFVMPADALFWTAQFRRLGAWLMFGSMVVLPTVTVAATIWTQEQPPWLRQGSFWAKDNLSVSAIVVGIVTAVIGAIMFVLNRRLARRPV